MKNTSLINHILIIFSIILFTGCSEDDDNIVNTYGDNVSNITFILSEGSFQSNDASLWLVNDGILNESSLNPTGDTGNSMTVNNNKLYVVNNGTSNLVIYSIESNGTLTETNVIDLESSSPREIVIIDNVAYISQCASKSIAAVDLASLVIDPIDVPGCPEGLATDGESLYAVIKYEDTSVPWPYPAGNTIEKINLTSREIVESISVSSNPDKILYHNSYLYVTSQYGDYLTGYFYVTDKIDISSSTVKTKDHGGDVSFGSDLGLHNDRVYRAYQNGIIAFNVDLSIDTTTYIGADLTGLYSMTINEDLIYLGFSDYSAPDNVVVMDFNGTTISNFEVGANPGSFAFWKSE